MAGIKALRKIQMGKETTAGTFFAMTVVNALAALT
jgi:hypothetical protein